MLSRDQLMAQARGRAMDAFDRSIDLLVSRLRQKLLGESGAAAANARLGRQVTPALWGVGSR